MSDVPLFLCIMEGNTGALFIKHALRLCPGFHRAIISITETAKNKISVADIKDCTVGRAGISFQRLIGDSV